MSTKVEEVEAEADDVKPQDWVRIFVENPLQNSSVQHIKMKMPPKVFCMRVNRANQNLTTLFQLVAARIKLDQHLWRIIGLSLASNHAEIDAPDLLENNDTIRLQIETSLPNPRQAESIESQIQTEILQVRSMGS